MWTTNTQSDPPLRAWHIGDHCLWIPDRLVFSLTGAHRQAN